MEWAKTKYLHYIQILLMGSNFTTANAPANATLVKGSMNQSRTDPKVIMCMALVKPRRQGHNVMTLRLLIKSLVHFADVGGNKVKAAELFVFAFMNKPEMKKEQSLKHVKTGRKTDAQISRPLKRPQYNRPATAAK
jgi:hypothetical protein